LGLRAALVAATAVLAACSVMTGTPEAPIDPNVFPKGYKMEVAAFLRTYLNNPTKVRDASISEPVLRPVGQRQQYVSCVRYNPRDENEKYLGHQENLAIFFGGKLNQFLASNREWCGTATYQRFPEAEALTP
jgi:hypothetical protein